MDFIEKVKGFLLEPSKTFDAMKEEPLEEALKFYAVIAAIYSALLALLLAFAGNLFGTMMGFGNMGIRIGADNKSWLVWIYPVFVIRLDTVYSLFSYHMAAELGAGDISGLTITPGLYKWGTGVMINNGVTLSGGANDVWIFQIAQDLTVGNGAIVTLSGGAQTKNIFWQISGQTTIGTTSAFKGNTEFVLSSLLITLET